MVTEKNLLGWVSLDLLQRGVQNKRFIVACSPYIHLEISHSLVDLVVVLKCVLHAQQVSIVVSCLNSLKQNSGT